MLGFFYRWLLRFHPPSFRERFADEMMSIFDHVEGTEAAAKLVADAFISLVRQWTMRWEYWEEKAAVRVPVGADGVPVFFSLESFKPRRGALIGGAVVTWMMCSALFFEIRDGRAHSMYLPHVSFESEAGTDAKPPASAPHWPSAATPRLPSPTQSTAKSRTNPSGPGRPLPGKATSSEPGTQPALSEIREQTRLNAANDDCQTLIRPPLIPCDQPFVPTRISREPLWSYAGIYTTDPPNVLTILITVEEGELAIEFPGEPKQALVQLDERRFVYSGAKNNWIEFIKLADRSEYDVHICRNNSEIRGQRKTN